MCKPAAVRPLKQTQNRENLPLKHHNFIKKFKNQLQSKKCVQLTQKIKLKKNNMYLMHCVQPVTAMLPVLLSDRPFTQIKLFVRPVYCPGYHTDSARGLSLFSQLGYKRFYATNSSFIIRSENRDGELPTRRRRLREQHAPNLQERTGRPILCSHASLTIYISAR